MPKHKFYSRVLAVLASVVVLCWGILDALNVKDEARRMWQGYMAETATSDASQLEAWLATFANQTQRLAADPRVRHVLASDGATANISEVVGNARRALVEFNVLFGAKFIYLFNRDSSPSIVLEGSPQLAGDTLTAMATSFEAKRPTYQPLIRGAGVGYLGTALPVQLPNGEALGYVMAVYPLDNALARLGSPAASDRGAKRYLVRLDHQGRPQAMRWPHDDEPKDPVSLSKTPARWPLEASKLSEDFPKRTPYVDVDGVPVYAWMSPRQVDGHWATMVTAAPTLIYRDVPQQMMMLGLRTLMGLVVVWALAHGLQWCAHKNPLKGQGDAAMRAVLMPIQRWRNKRKKKPQAEKITITASMPRAEPRDDELFGHGGYDYTPPPPLRQVEWADAPATPERMAFFVRDSLQHERVRLFYQPIVDLSTDKPAMFETLLRLADEKNNMVLPPDFLPAAKQFDLLKDIDDAVLLASIRKHAQLQSHGKRVTLSINLSETAFRNENFKKQFVEGVASRSIFPQYLVFEVNSNALLQDSAAMGFIRDMQAMGCRFAIDYFGGGVKAVTATTTLKFDYMKINALRFADIETNIETLKQFRDVVDAAQAARLEVIVEKVETPLMYRLCKKLGVPYAQGFFIAPPAAKFDVD